MGVNGLMKFRNLWAAIEPGNFQQAYLEALDSNWYRQTPSRAKRVASGLI
jgi:lysozyme